MQPINTTIIRGGTIALAAGACAFAVPSLGTAGARTNAKPTSETLSFKTRLTKLTAVPVAGQTSRKPRPGDYVVITDQYLAHGKVVGHDIVHCVLATKRTSLCIAAVSLPKGQLELQGIGPAGGTGHFTIAVTGGTRAYAHVTGTATIRSGAHNTGTETFRLRR
jgi:hypothetical protein